MVSRPISRLKAEKNGDNSKSGTLCAGVCFSENYNRYRSLGSRRKQNNTFRVVAISRQVGRCLLWRYPWTTNTRRALRRLWLEKTENEQFILLRTARSSIKNINRGNDISFLWFFHLSRWSTEISSAVKRDADDDDIDKQTSRTEPILRCTSRSCRQSKRAGFPRAPSHVIVMSIRLCFKKG